MIPDIVRAERYHIQTIADNVREADRQEMWAFSCQTPEQVLEQSFEMSQLAFTGTLDGVPVVMFGVVSASIVGGTGRPWLIGTEALDRHSIIFLKRCRRQLDIFQMCFDRLENYVDVRNKRAIQWLKWLGFTFGETVPLGPFNHPFMKFSREAK